MSSIESWPQAYVDVLTDVAERRAPSIAAKLSTPTRLTPSERELLQFALAAEMTARGLEVDDEPNDYGRQLDDIIGLLNSDAGA